MGKRKLLLKIIPTFEDLNARQIIAIDSDGSWKPISGYYLNDSEAEIDLRNIINENRY